MKSEHTSQVGFVFVHGAGLGRWIWEQTVDGLDDPVLLAEFPKQAEAVYPKKWRANSPQMEKSHTRSAVPVNKLTLEDYIQHMNAQIENWLQESRTHKFVLVAHSFGGVPSLRLASDWSERLAGFVAIGAAIPDGGSFLSALPLPQRFFMSTMMRLAGTRPPESAIRGGLCNDLTTELANQVVQQFTPESRRVYMDSVRVLAPAHVPKWYVLLKQDKEFGIELQHSMIRRLAPQHVAELDTGHLPMLADPAGVRSLLQQFMKQIG